MTRIATVVGARPQFVKASAISHLLRGRPDAEEILIHTGQHYDPGLSGVFFQELGIPVPEVSLGIGSMGHGAQTGRMLEALEAVLIERRPNWVLVYGDTNSTLAGALAAAKLHIPIAHVEAGLRSFNRRMPEEINRVVTDHVSDLLFAPTEAALANLAREGIDPDRVVSTGDVMQDVALRFAERAACDLTLDELGLEEKGFVLATVHRAENTDDPARLQAIVAAFDTVAKRLPVVWPVHPRTRPRLASLAASPSATNGGALPNGFASPGVRAIEPVGYLAMTRLLRGAAVVATDSGGVQKEAYFHRVPCVTLRTETEWVELISNGWNRLADPGDAEAMTQAILGAIGSTGADVDLYGDGRAAETIVSELMAR